MDSLSIATFLGGLVGAGLRAAIAPDQPALSRKSLVDMVVGGLIGVLVPVTVGLPDGWSLLQKAAAVAVASYTGANLLQDIVGQISRRS